MKSESLIELLLVTVLIINIPLLKAAERTCPSRDCLSAMKSTRITAQNCRNQAGEAQWCLGRLRYNELCYCGTEEETVFLRYNDNPGLLAEETCEMRGGDQCQFNKLMKCYRKARKAFEQNGTVEDAIACIRAWNGNPIHCFWKKAEYMLLKSQLTPSTPWKQLVIQALRAIQDGCTQTLAADLLATDWCFDFGGLRLYQDHWIYVDEVESSRRCVRQFLNKNPVCEKARPLVEAGYAVLHAAARRKYKLDDELEFIMEACEEIWYNDYDY